jgi:cell wall-associated NlpC family hydrolase
VHPSAQLINVVPPRVRSFRRLRGLPRLQIALTSTVVITATLALGGTSAHADPTVAQVEAQIAAAWNEAEPLIEQYNGIHEQYQRNKTEQDRLQTAIAPLQREVDLAQLRVGVIAERAYKGGPADGFGALLNAGTPQNLADQLTFLDEMARSEASQVSEVAATKAKYDAQKAPIDKLVTDLAKQDADLAARRATIEAKLSDLQKLRIQAYGASGGGAGKYRPWTCPAEYLPTNGYKAAAFACAQAGKPYVWAAAGPKSYDCSGLVLAAWKQVGVYLPHNAASQRRSMPYVNRKDIQIGDLVFYFSDIHHVAMYVGDGKVINAPNFGDFVRMTTIDNWPVHSIGRPG